MNKHRTQAMIRKRRAGRGELALQRPYAKPEVGYDLSNAARKEMAK